MKRDIKILDILSEKTKKDIDLFVVNSFLSEDKERNKEFYNIIQRVIVESSLGSKDKIKSK
jgi:hypothetical protein